MADDTGRTFPHREMDRRDREEVHRVVVAATSTGEVALHTEDLKAIFALAKRGAPFPSFILASAMKQLHVPHAQIRFLAFELLGMLFARSSELRRDIATVHLDNIIKLALGVKDGARCPLPEPLPFQKRLQENCIMQLQKWYEKYGEEFPKVCHPLFMWLS